MAVSPHTEPAAAPPADRVVREVKPPPTQAAETKASPALQNVVEITEKYRTVRLLVVVAGAVGAAFVLNDVLMKIVDQPPYIKVTLGVLALICGQGGALGIWLKHRRDMLMQSGAKEPPAEKASTSEKEVE